MRRFLKNIAFFSLPFSIGLIWLLYSPYQKEYAYNAIQKDCRSGKWIYQRLFEHPKPIDIAFIGTSKTMCDVNDLLVQERLANEKGQKAEIANLGVCRTGENLHYLIAQDLIEQKHPQILIYELSAHLATNSHFHFPNVAATSDVFAAPLWFNDDYLADIGKLTWMRLVYNREKALGIQRKYEEILTDPDHSFMVVSNDLVADPAEMERARKVRIQSLSNKIPTGIPGIIHRAATNFPYQYLRKVQQLCLASGTRLYFIYLPRYGAPKDGPRNLSAYSTLAPILYPPDSIFSNPALHFDNSHLNQRGAGLLSDWLVETVSDLLKE